MDDFTLFLEPEGEGPLYRRLYDGLVREISSGGLAAGERLPSKRRLAQALRVSVNTVDTAYQMLAAEGYLLSRPRSGFVVRRVEKLTAGPAAPVPEEEPSAGPAWAFDLGTGGVDPALFPWKTWRRLQRDALAGDPDLLRRGHPQGDAELRLAIARYLHEARGAVCAPGQIVVGAGIEYLLGLLARLFPKETFALEDPGYRQTARVLSNNGVKTVPVPVDGEGLSLAELEASGAQIAYLTPSHQFPTGAVMPVGRRTGLLGWAAAAPGRLLIEDDYDSEFRFDGRPLPCLQGLGGGERVIYIGTFSRGLAPGIRAAYLALPGSLLGRFRERFGDYACTVSRPDQQTLRLFLEEGHYARHLARCRTAYRHRRDALTGALAQVLGPGRVTVTGGHTGLHLLAQVRLGLSEQELVARARQAGVWLSGLGEYARLPRSPEEPSTLVLGYGGLPEEEVLPAVQALARAWEVTP